MIKIFADVNNQELIFDFEYEKNSWVGLCTLPDERIIIFEKDNVPQENSLLITLGISTPITVLFQRFQISYANYKEQLEVGIEPTDEKIEHSVPQPYNPDDIKVRREGFSVFEVNRMITEQEDIDLNPDFQRNLVWDNSRKSALIESILLGIPIPVFYFAESKSGKYHVVDGLQRLSTIKQYFANEFPLKNLEHLGECEGKYYKEDSALSKTKNKALERKYTRRLENAQLIVNIIESASPQKVKYDIFKRINTGGRPLNHQEVRNCIAEDNVREFLKTLANSEEFLGATMSSVNDRRMDAQELVLRFTGFNLEREGILLYNGDMNPFLDDALDFLNSTSQTRLNRYKEDFLKSMRINKHLFGQFCFRKCLSANLLEGARKQFINKALFVTWGIEAISLNEKQVIKKVESSSMAFDLAKILDKKEKYYTILTTGTSDKQNLKDASEFARNLLKSKLLL